MLNWSLAFLIAAVLAALFGFGENVAIATSLSETFFAISTGLLLVSLAIACKRTPRPKPKQDAELPAGDMQPGRLRARIRPFPRLSCHNGAETTRRGDAHVDHR